MSTSTSSELDTVLDASRLALRDFIAAAERSAGVWQTPRAPGKWSPSQLSEHVARTIEESANEASGLPHNLPRLPAPIRALARTFFFNRVIKNERFPKARTGKALDPFEGPASPADARIRLEGALAKLEQACRVRGGADGRVQTTAFGSVPVADYARFQLIHTRHHSRQFPGAG